MIDDSWNIFIQASRRMINVGEITFAKGCMCYTLYFLLFFNSSSFILHIKMWIIVLWCFMSFLSHSCFFTVHIHTFSSRLFAVEKKIQSLCLRREKGDEKIVEKLELLVFQRCWILTRFDGKKSISMQQIWVNFIMENFINYTF